MVVGNRHARNAERKLARENKMTAVAAWIRAIKRDVEELFIISDSRLSDGRNLDCAPKIFPLQGGDIALCFAGRLADGLTTFCVYLLENVNLHRLVGHQTHEALRDLSWDFVTDRTENGSCFRILTLLEEHTRQCLAIHPAWSIRAIDVITVVEAAIARYGVPEHLRSDNGPEFIAS
jgi:hypothetical protein